MEDNLRDQPNPLAETKSNRDQISEENKQPSTKKDILINEDKFMFDKGGISFLEIEDGKVKCRGCKNVFARIIGHLKKSKDCQGNIDLAELELVWEKFRKKRRNIKYAKKRKAEDNENFLQERAKRQRKCVQMQKIENEELFLKEQAKRKGKCV